MSLIVNLIGAGRLGKTIGRLIVVSKTARIGGICNASLTSSQEAVEFIKDGSAYINIQELPAADVTFITTPDDLIKEVSINLTENPYLQKGSVVLHCSGSLPSSVLDSLRGKGCFIASAHPMRSFANPETSVEQYSGTYCAIEGDPEVLPLIHRMLASIGSVTYEIDSEKKSLYHAAGVFASNYLVTLAEQALSCLTCAGVEHDLAMRVISNIMQGTVSNLEKSQSPKASLTGPIKRGDTQTIDSHIASLDTEERRKLYAALGHSTLSLTDHNESTKARIQASLEKETTESSCSSFFMKSSL